MYYLKLVAVILILLVGLIGCGRKNEEVAVKSMDWKREGLKVLMVIAPQDFRDEEYQIPRERLEKCGVTITVASTSLDEAVGMKGGKVKPDILLKDVKVADYNAVIFVGGVGAEKYYQDEEAQRIARETVEKDKVLGAICLAPVILANAGLLKGKKATVYESEKETLKAKGAIYEERKVVQDGLIITGNGPEAAAEFAELIKEALGKRPPGSPRGR